MNQNQDPVSSGSSKTVLIILIIILIMVIIAGGGYFFFITSVAQPSSSTKSQNSSSNSSQNSAATSVASIKESHCLKNPAKSGQIKVTQPSDHTLISKDNITIAGTANAFENQFNYRIKDCQEGILASGFILAEGEMGQNPPFSRTFSLTNNSGTDIVIELFELSAVDGRETNLTQVPLRIK